MENLELAKKILSSYSFVNPQIEFIRHNENMTFKVTDEDSKKYLLRIHVPITSGFNGIQQTHEGLCSEIFYLKELFKSGILVQQPVANKMGDYVTTYEDSSIRCNSTVLEWIEGETLSLEKVNIDDFAYKLGVYIGNLHQFSKQLKPDAKFIRPIYGIEQLELVLETIKYGVEIDIFTNEDYQLMIKTVSEIKKQIKELNLSQDNWGLIHADYQPGNIIVNEVELALIDFSLSGYGYYLFDLGSAGTLFPKEYRPTFIKGYSTKMNLHSDYVRYIEGFIIYDILISYGLFIEGSKNTWIKDHFHRQTENLCKNYLNNETFFLS